MAFEPERIDVQAVLRHVPHFETFCSVAKLCDAVENLRRGPADCTVEVAGHSVNGQPIHHVCFGRGRAVKALVVGFPHCHEPIGSLTVYSLMRLLQEQQSDLTRADVEWHIVPCIDPDGAVLNEGWTQKPFSFEAYLKHRHVQTWLDQVDCSFPITYKKLAFAQPSREAEVLRSLLEQIRPDFFFSLHNSIAAGGAWYPISRDLGSECYQQLRELRELYCIPLQQSIAHQKWCAQFGEGIYEMFTVRKLYDDLEQRVSAPESFVKMGAASWDYLATIREDAVVFAAELPHAKYAASMNLSEDSGENLRQFRLRLEAENKFLITVIAQEWEGVKDQLDCDNPFYKKTVQEIIPVIAKLSEGVPLSLGANSTQDILFNPAYARTMTLAERSDIYLGDRFNVLCHTYEFVRLLQLSSQTSAIRRARQRLEGVFARALAEMPRILGSDAFSTIDCDTLCKVQLGSGLIALNSVLRH